MALKKPQGWWPRTRRVLYWTHRWLGVAGCLLFVMWFVSGVVMMYVAFPSLTDAERLAGLSPLRLDDARITPGQALASLPEAVRGQPPRRMALEMIAGGPQAGPVWRIVDGKGGRHSLSAIDGRALGRTDAAAAQAIAQVFSGEPQARVAETLQQDQWTVPQSLNPLRPLHRVELGDAAGGELYVSSVSGEVVRDTTRHERFWNWLGAVPHWIYFTPLRADAPLWRDVVLWVSGASIVSAVTGLLIGILRIRVRTRFRNGSMSPYGGWFKWHHVAGLLGGVTLFTWIVSGWLSMDPNRWFQRTSWDAAALARYHGKVDLSSVRWPPAMPADARELQVLALDGHALLQWRDGNGRTVVSDARNGLPFRIDADAAARAARRLWSADAATAPVADTLWLTEEDAHWYSHHHERVLPVWRVTFADPARTWLHIDPRSGQILGTSDDTSRTRRWLFNAAHSLDFPWLIQYRPAWDLVVWLLSILGTVVSVSGVVLGWRRLRKRKSPAVPASSQPLSPLGDTP